MRFSPFFSGVFVGIVLILASSCTAPGPKPDAPQPAAASPAPKRHFPGKSTSRPSTAKPPAPTAASSESDEAAEAAAEAASEKQVQALSHYATGVSKELNQEFEPALEEFYQSAMADPDNEQLVVEVSRRLLQLKQADKAIGLLTQSAARTNASPALYAWLGTAQAQLGKKDQAIRSNRLALKKAPTLLLACQNLTALYLQTGKTNEAVKLLDESVRQPKADALFLVGILELLANNASMLDRGGNSVRPRVTNILERVAKLKPENPVVREKMADGYKFTGQYAKASEIYLNLLQRFPGVPGLREKLTECYLRADDKQKAMEQLELVVRENPTRPQGYYVLGSLALESREYQKAADAFEKAILLDATFEEAYFQLALAQMALNKPQDALTTIDKVRARHPQSFAVEFYSALACGRLKQYKDALEHFTAAEVIAKATEPERLNQAFYFHLGSAHERNGDIAQAETYFKKSLELSPDFAEALNYLGYMWAENGLHLKEAKVMIDKALKLEPKNAAYLDSLGWVLFKLNQPKEALDYIQQSIALNTEPDATLYDHLGDVLAALQQLDAAREAYRKSLAVEPNEKIQKKLDGLPAK